jgi:hypothetical protein
MLSTGKWQSSGLGYRCRATRSQGNCGKRCIARDGSVEGAFGGEEEKAGHTVGSRGAAACTGYADAHGRSMAIGMQEMRGLAYFRGNPGCTRSPSGGKQDGDLFGTIARSRVGYTKNGLNGGSNAGKASVTFKVRAAGME